VAFIDYPLLAVCHPKRSARHKVFAGLTTWDAAQRHEEQIPPLLNKLLLRKRSLIETVND
jgi:hypothetical protein